MISADPCGGVVASPGPVHVHVSRNRALQLLSYDPEKGFDEELRFPVFEKKMHQRGGGGGTINELLLRDLDNDGKTDVAFLVHDRLIVYIQ